MFKQPETLKTTSNHDIAQGIYQGLMHHITTNQGTHVEVDAIIDSLKLIYETDETPVAVAIRTKEEQS